MMSHSYLIALLFGTVLIAVLPNSKFFAMRQIALFASILAAILFFFSLGAVNISTANGSYFELNNLAFPLLSYLVKTESVENNLNSVVWLLDLVAIDSSLFGLDGLASVLISLTVLIFPVCFLAVWEISKKVKYLLVILLVLEIFLITSFLVADLFLFYVLFEALLAPFFFLIYYWGSRERKVRASHYFVLYTYVASWFMYFGVLHVFTHFGSLSNEVLFSASLTFTEELFLWWMFFPVLATKIPLYPVHGWLPEAHVEAPAVGSMILASVILKVGCYGCLRYLITFLPNACFYYWPVVVIISVIGVLFASACAIRQVDIKRIVAYSSVAHMSLVALGLFSYSEAGLLGSIYLMVGHGVVSAALFFCIGVLYDRYGTRLLMYYGGLLTVMPVFGFFIFIFAFANMSFPGTCNFIGEIAILQGLMVLHPSVLILVLLGTFFAAVYSLLAINRIFFGTLKMTYLKRFTDVSAREFVVLAYLLVLMLFLGVTDTTVTALVSDFILTIIV